MAELSMTEYHKERHTGKLPTPEIKESYALRTAEGLEQAAHALLEAAAALRENPDHMLSHAFAPHPLQMRRRAITQLLVHYFFEDDERIKAVDVTSLTRTIPDDSRTEVGVRFVWVEGEGVIPREDTPKCL